MRSQNDEMRIGLDIVESAIQLQEHFLREIFRPVTIAQHAQSDAIHGALVATHQRGECRRFAGAGAGQ